MSKAKREPKYKVWQVGDKWRCAASDDPAGSYCEADTPDAAIAAEREAHAFYLRFIDHLHARCVPADCDYCRKGSPTRGGLMTSKEKAAAKKLEARP
jgi:hypothetical protein